MIAVCPYNENYILARRNNGHVSINDMLDVDLMFVMVVIAISAIIFVFIWYKKMKNDPTGDVYVNHHNIYKTQKVSAKLISKTTANHPMYVHVKVNYLIK